jgi:hypothetical protein
VEYQDPIRLHPLENHALEERIREDGLGETRKFRRFCFPFAHPRSRRRPRLHQPMQPKNQETGKHHERYQHQENCRAQRPVPEGYGRCRQAFSDSRNRRFTFGRSIRDRSARRWRPSTPSHGTTIPTASGISGRSCTTADAFSENRLLRPHHDQGQRRPERSGADRPLAHHHACIRILTSRGRARLRPLFHANPRCRPAPEISA